MTLDEARDLIGAGVIYRPRWGGTERNPQFGPPEDGTVVSVNDRYVMVSYGRGLPKATAPEDLTPFAQGITR